MLIFKCCGLIYKKIPEWSYYYEDLIRWERVIVLPDRSEFRVPMNTDYIIEEIEDE